MWIYKGEGLKGLEEIPVRVVTFNEANHTKTLEEIEQAKANLVVFHHENDIQRWNLNCHTTHILHGAAYTSSVEKTIDCIVAGVVNEKVYPLRTRLCRLVESGKIKGKVRRHPGYRLESKSECRHQYREYIRDLASAKILLTCSSVYRYPLAKIMEAMAVGTVVISDMPDDQLFQGTLGNHIIEVSNEMSDNELCQVIHDAIADKTALRERSEVAKIESHKFSTRSYAERLYDEIRNVYSVKQCK